MKGTRFSQEKIIGILKESECKTSTVGAGSTVDFR